MLRLELLQALQTQLETITTANGYNTNIGSACTYWDTYEQDYNGVPSVTFRDVDTNYEWANTRQTNRLVVEVEAIAVTTQADKLEVSCHLMEDIYQAMVKVPWYSNVIAVRPVSESKQVEAKGKPFVCCTLTLEIEYRY